MNKLRIGCIVLMWTVAASLLISCQAELPENDPWVEARPLAKHLPAYQASRDADKPVDTYAEVEPVGTINIDDAIAVALRRSPSLAVASFDARISEAEIMQAGLIPNPELAVRLDHLGSDDDARLRLMLRQDIERDDKREKRIQVAGAERDLAGWDYEAMRLEVVSQAKMRFAAVWIAQEKVKVYENMLSNASRTKTRINEQMSIGAMKQLDADKAGRRKVEAEILLEQAKRQLRSARQQLAGTWGSREAKFEKVVGELGEIGELPLEQAVYNMTVQSPLLARWSAEISRCESEVALEKAEGKEDVTVGAGYRWDSGNSKQSDILLDVQFPLPIADRNQGDILGARYELIKAKSMHRAATVLVQIEASEAYQAAAAAAFEAKMVKQEIIPASEKTFAAIDEAFAAGIGSLNDLLDAQREVIRAEEDYYDALLTYHQAIATLEGLVGQNITSP